MAPSVVAAVARAAGLAFVSMELQAVVREAVRTSPLGAATTSTALTTRAAAPEAAALWAARHSGYAAGAVAPALSLQG
jgi:hypothetical protein